MQSTESKRNFRIADMFLKHPGITDTPENIELFVKKQIDMRMSRLRKIMAFKRLNVNDVRQDFLAALVSAMMGYDTTKSSWRTFVGAVCNKKYCSLMRTYKCEKKFLQNSESLDHIDQESEQLPTYNTDFETATDVATAIASMPERLQHIAKMLQTNSAADVASHLGVSRSTITRAIKQIRVYFIDCGLGSQYNHATN